MNKQGKYSYKIVKTDKSDEMVVTVETYSETQARTEIASIINSLNSANYGGILWDSSPNNIKLVEFEHSSTSLNGAMYQPFYGGGSGGGSSNAHPMYNVENHLMNIRTLLEEIKKQGQEAKF